MAPTYYTLTEQGRHLYDTTTNPTKVIKTLGEMLTENDVPRTPDQIAHEAATPVGRVEAALAKLLQQGYVAVAHLPQPKEKMQTPKPHFRPIEEIVEAEIRAGEARKRYNHSEKGMIAHYNFEHSDKGLTKNAKYWKGRGRLIQKAYRIRRNIKSMTEHHSDPKAIAEEQAKLREVEAQLAAGKKEAEE